MLLTASAVAASSIAIHPLGGVTSAGLLPAIGVALSTRPSGDAQRNRLLTFIAEHEGTHLGGVVRGLGFGNHQASLHLSVLEREGRIWSRRDGRLLRFHTVEGVSRMTPVGELPSPPFVHAPDSIQIRLLDRLARVPREGRAEGPLTQRELANEIGCSQQLISHHLRQMSEGDLVRSRRVGVRKRWLVTPTGFSALQAGLEALPLDPEPLERTAQEDATSDR